MFRAMVREVRPMELEARHCTIRTLRLTGQLAGVVHHDKAEAKGLQRIIQHWESTLPVLLLSSR